MGQGREVKRKMGPAEQRSATPFQTGEALPVIQVPTNMAMVRADRNDQVYKTKEGKWSAVVREIADRHENGQPVLVGTISVEVSELLSERLTKRGMWSALEIPSEQAAVEYEDRQQIMSTFGSAPPEAIAAFLEKRPAEFAD